MRLASWVSSATKPLPAYPWWSVAPTAVPPMRPASASQLTPNRQSTIAVLDAGGYASPGRTRARLSILTSPESDAVRVSVNVWYPAPSWTPAGTRSQVSQFAVAGRLTFCWAPPSTERVRVRVWA